MEKEEGWSSEGSDGGIPVVPVPRGPDFQPRGKFSEGPWRPQEHRGQIGGQLQLWEDPDKATRPSKSSLSGGAAPFTSRPVNLEDYMKKATLSDDKSAKNRGHCAKANHPNAKKGVPNWLED
jgi:hypothetical protein